MVVLDVGSVYPMGACLNVKGFSMVNILEIYAMGHI